MEIIKLDVVNALPKYYLPYAKYVNQTRSLPDARDCLKTGTRFILYAQYLEKLTYDKTRRKAVDTESAAMKFSPHGNASILGTAVRLSQPFSMCNAATAAGVLATQVGRPMVRTLHSSGASAGLTTG